MSARVGRVEIGVDVRPSRMAAYPGRTDVLDVRPSRMAAYPGRTDVMDVRPSRMAAYPGRTDVRRSIAAETSP